VIYQTRINKAGGGPVFGFLEMEDSIGNPLVYGVSYGNVDLGKGPVDGGNGADQTRADGYIGRYGPNAPAWVNQIVGPGEDKIVASATAPGGEVFDASNGAVRWQKSVATAGSDGAFTASIGATGDIYAVVNLGGTFDFGKPLIGPPAPASVVMRIVP
jgi:hypothetical protein